MAARLATVEYFGSMSVHVFPTASDLAAAASARIATAIGSAGRSFSLGLAGVAMVGAGIAAVWAAVGLYLGKRYERIAAGLPPVAAGRDPE